MKSIIKLFTKILIFPLLLIFFFSYATPSVTAEKQSSDKTIVHYFEDRLCSVCAEYKNFLLELQYQYDFELNIYPITETKKLTELAEQHNIKDHRLVTPTFFINNNFFQPNNLNQQTKDLIISAIKGEDIKQKDQSLFINIPFTKKQIDVSKWSLPALTVVLGSLDGFNVCSLGALILIISIVLAFDSRKKIFLFGGLFILTTAIVYGLLVFAWGKLFEIMVGQLEILRTLVGLAALTGSFYFFKEFLRMKKYGATCSSAGSGLIKKATKKLQGDFKVKEKNILFLGGSIMLFAAIVTIVELPCSIGIPIAFTGILVEKGLALPAYIFYVLGYIFFYLLIELIIFAGAVTTKKIWFADSKMITWTTFIGAVILLYLSIYYLIGF